MLGENANNLLQCLAFAEAELCMECLSIGRGADDYVNDLVGEVAGKGIFFRLCLRGIVVDPYAQSMDRVEPLSLLVTVGSDVSGFQIIGRLLRQFQQSNLQNLDQRPIQLGDIGPDGFAIS